MRWPSACGRGLSCAPVMTMLAAVMFSSSGNLSGRPKIIRPSGTMLAQAIGGQALQMGQQWLRQRIGHLVGIKLRGDIFQQRRSDGAGLFNGGQHAHIALPRLRRFVAR